MPAGLKYAPQTLNHEAVAGSFSATGQSASTKLLGYFNLSLSGFGTGSINVERSFDGTNWKVVNTYTADTEQVGFEPEAGVLYRLNCTAYTAGPIVYRLSQ